MAPVTATLIALNIGAFLLSAALPRLALNFALWPLGAEWMFVPGAGFAPWQLVSYAFLHGGLMHLAFNMFGLYMFGEPLERVLGGRRFIVYYFACVLAAALTQLVVLRLAGTYAPTVGASGGVFGLLLGYAIRFPHHRVTLLFPPIPMSARTFAIVYAAIELVLGVTGSQTGVAHFAHLGGMAGGWFLLRRWRVGAAPVGP